jgi:hypothetical protein
MTASLPLSTLGEVQADEEIWEENDGGAHFKVTRHQLPVEEYTEMLALSVSGVASERRRVINEFAQVFGIPATKSAIIASDYIDIVAWVSH